MRSDNKAVADELTSLAQRMSSVLSQDDVDLLRDAALMIDPQSFIIAQHNEIVSLRRKISEMQSLESWRTNPDQMGR